MPVIWCDYRDAQDLLDHAPAGPPVVRVPATVVTAREFMDCVAAHAAVPDYFGRNWDAFADIVGDLGGLRLVIAAPGELDRELWSMLTELARDDVIGERFVVYAVVRPDDVGDTSPPGD